MGLLQDLAGGWTAPLVLILGAVSVMTACGLLAIRNRTRCNATPNPFAQNSGVS